MFLGHVIGQIFCLYIKLFHSSSCNSVDLWSSMFFTDLYIKLARKLLLKTRDFLFMRIFKYTLFVIQNDTNAQNMLFDVQETCVKICRTVEFWITVSSRTIFPKTRKLNSLQREQKKASTVPDKEVENLDDHAFHKLRDLFNPKVDEGM